MEKNTGQVRRIINSSLFPEPLLDLNVLSQSERGMLGVAVQKNENNKGRLTVTNVFLYLTESIAEEKDNQSNLDMDYCKYDFKDSIVGNSVYK